MMIRESREHSLPEPSFGGNQPGEFGTTVWRDWLTDEVMAELGLNERQKKGVEYARVNGMITNSEYQDLAGVARKTAARDLSGLVECDVFKLVGTRRGSHYVLMAGK